MDKAVKSCPWCGARAKAWGEEINQIDPGGEKHPKKTEWFIVCDHKIACMASWVSIRHMPRFTSKEAAIKAWNNRNGDNLFIVATAAIVDIAKKQPPQNMPRESEEGAGYTEGWNNACDYIKKCLWTLVEEGDK